jgi:hypothetical protein
MKFSLADWTRMPDDAPEKRSFFFLRGIRDAAAAELLSLIGDDEEDSDPCVWVNRIIFEQYESAYRWLLVYFYRREMDGDEVTLLWKVSCRVARLERERCRIKLDPCHDRELLTA